MVFPLKPPSSYGFPMVFPLKPPYSYGFPMVFPLKPPFSYDFPMVFPFKPPFSYDFPFKMEGFSTSQSVRAIAEVDPTSLPAESPSRMAGFHLVNEKCMGDETRGSTHLEMENVVHLYPFIDV